jgi:hypothetical protein
VSLTVDPFRRQPEPLAARFEEVADQWVRRRDGDADGGNLPRRTRHR